MDFCVKMKTVILGLLISFSLAGCSTNSYYADMNMNNTYEQPQSVIGAVYNLGKHSAYSVPRSAQMEQERCVYFALDTAQVGESCKWRTDDASGTVRVSAIYPNMCHDLTNTIWYKGRTKSWTDRACLKGNNWRFNSR